MTMSLAWSSGTGKVTVGDTMDSLTQPLLEEIIRRESRSLLQYVSEAFPWTTPEERETLVQVEKVIAEERQGAAALARLLQRHHLPPPFIGPYPMEFANINYVTLDHLLPLLVVQQRRAIGDLERDLTCLLDEEARTEVKKVLEMKRRHLAVLEKMAARRPAPVSA